MFANPFLARFKHILGCFPGHFRLERTKKAAFRVHFRWRRALLAGAFAALFYFFAGFRCYPAAVFIVYTPRVCSWLGVRVGVQVYMAGISHTKSKRKSGRVVVLMLSGLLHMARLHFNSR